MIPEPDYDALPPAKKIVKPRTRSFDYLPVVIIYKDLILAEDGEVSTRAELFYTLPERAPTLFATMGAADFLAELDAAYSVTHPQAWQWRVSTNDRDIRRPDGFKLASLVTTAVHFFGFKGGNYHKLIDPMSMYGHRLDEIWPDAALPIGPIKDAHWRLPRKLMAWATAIRDFCHQNQIDVRPTIGGVSSQFLTDSRFYPNRRRKVPMVINQRARENLPGNHYALSVTPTPSEEWRAYYLDQSRAHHYHARTTKLPNADTLYAHGTFTTLSRVAFPQPWTDFYGLYCLDLSPPEWRSVWDSLWDVQQLTKVFVYSNELPHLLDMGYRVTGVRAAWGSRHQDAGLARYAKWSEEQLDKYGDPPWLKPLLLSAYGTLATKARVAEAIFKQARSGERVTLQTGHHTLTGKLTRGGKKLEPGIANVLHRGMIEAATRSESIGLAQTLEWQGYRVLSIYADAVIVQCDDDKPLPVLIDPWRCKKTLNHLQFINQQAFISGEMTKLPGVGHDLRGYRRNFKARAPRLLNVAAEMEYLES